MDGDGSAMIVDTVAGTAFEVGRPARLEIGGEVSFLPPRR